jgi:hypothetical protein
VKTYCVISLTLSSMGQGHSSDNGGLCDRIFAGNISSVFHFLVPLVNNYLPFLGNACFTKSEETTLECVVNSQVRVSIIESTIFTLMCVRDQCLFDCYYPFVIWKKNILLEQFKNSIIYSVHCIALQLIFLKIICSIGLRGVDYNKLLESLFFSTASLHVFLVYFRWQLKILFMQSFWILLRRWEISLHNSLSYNYEAMVADFV